MIRIFVDEDGVHEVEMTPDEVAAWEAEQASYYEPPVVKLPDLAPWQFRAMLHLSGKQPDLQTWINALPEPQKTIAQAKLEYTLTFQRDNDLVLAAQQALSLTDAQLDALWAQALSL